MSYYILRFFEYQPQRFYPIPDYFDLLRSAAKENDLEQIASIKRTLFKKELLNFMLKLNKGYSECAIIHYAAKYNRPQAIQALVEEFSHQERLAIFRMKYSTRCNALHFAATANISGSVDNTYSYEAAAKMKELLYLKEDHHFWLELLEEQQVDLDTVVHYAARHLSPRFLQLLSDGLDEFEWLKIISLKNGAKNTALETYFINMKVVSDGTHKYFIAALRGPLTDECWVNFIVSNNILRYLKPTMEVAKPCFSELTSSLSPELTRVLIKNWEELHPQSLELEQKPYSCSYLY